MAGTRTNMQLMLASIEISESKLFESQSAMSSKQCAANAVSRMRRTLCIFIIKSVKQHCSKLKKILFALSSHSQIGVAIIFVHLRWWHVEVSKSSF